MSTNSIKRGLLSVRLGCRMSCALPVQTSPSEAGRETIQLNMIKSGASASATGSSTSTDMVCMACHGPMHTHVDALCHMFHRARMYNDRAAMEVTDEGARFNDIAVAGDGIMGRGVLLDACRVRGVDYIAHDEPVRRDELERAAQETGVTLEPGDILLVRLGRQVCRRILGADSELRDGRACLAGLHPDTLEWLHGLDLALLVSDAAHDAIPGGYPGTHVPIHIGCLVHMGLHLLDNAALDDLAERCGEARQWSFMFSALPLRIPGATGCIVNPVAML